MELTKLKKIRKRLHWSQEDLARELGVSLFTIVRWERGTFKKLHRHNRELLRRFEGKVQRGGIESI